MKKILGLALAAVLVMAMVGGGTWAYFSDTESSTGNVITAGTIDLKIDTGDANEVILETGIINIKPGDTQLEYATLDFSATISDYYLTVGLDAKTEDTETDTDAETEAVGDGVGNLGDFVIVTFFVDLDSNDWDEGDIYLDEAGALQTVAAGPSPATPEAAAALLDAFEVRTWPGIDVDADPDDAARFYIYWKFPLGGTNEDNKAQTDSAQLDMLFELRQGTP